MFALDGDLGTCTNLPLKNDTAIPPYLISQISTQVLNERGILDSSDLAASFRIQLIGDGISCSTTAGPQRTLVGFAIMVTLYHTGKILHWSMLKAFADDKSNKAQFDNCFGDRRNNCRGNKLLVTSIFSFSYSVFKRLFSWVIKSLDCVIKG